MKHIVLSLSVCAFLAGAAVPVAKAEPVDMADLTCKDLVEMKSDDAGVVVFWMAGYFGGQSNDTTVDFKGLGKLAEALGGYCAQNPKQTVMGAIKKLAD